MCLEIEARKFMNKITQSIRLLYDFMYNSSIHRCSRLLDIIIHHLAVRRDINPLQVQVPKRANASLNENASSVTLQMELTMAAGGWLPKRLTNAEDGD